MDSSIHGSKKNDTKTIAENKSKTNELNLDR